MQINEQMVVPRVLETGERAIASASVAQIGLTDTTLAVYGSASFTPSLTLPGGMTGTPAGGCKFRVRDANGSAATYPITIIGPINGGASFVLDVAWGTAIIEWNGTGWQVWNNSASAASAGPTPRTWFVNGGAGAGGDGSFDAPFQLPSAAFAVANSGDVIMIASGTYTETNTLPDKDHLAICGAGRTATILVAPGGATAPTLKWAPASGSYSGLEIRDLTLRSANNSQECLRLDGDGTAVAGFSQFLDGACIIDNVICDKAGSTGDAAFFRSVDKLLIQDGIGSNIAGWNGSATFYNTGYVAVNNTIIGNGTTGVTVTYDDSGGSIIRPKNGRQGFNLLNASTVYGSVTLTKAPIFNGAPDSAILGDLIATSLQNFPGPVHALAVRFTGTIGAVTLPCSVTITAPAITGAAIPYVDCSDATFYCSQAKPFTVSGAAGLARFAPLAQKARFVLAAGGTAANSIVAGAETDLDIVESYYSQQAMLGVSGNGTIRRSSHDMGSLTSPGAQTITPPFPSGTTYHVSSEPTTAVAIGVSAKTNTGFTLAGAATVRCRLHLVK